MDFSYTTPNGVYRYVANADREGYDREVPVEYGDSVSFDFAAYLFSSSIGALYYTNVKEWIPAKDLEVLNPEYWDFSTRRIKLGSASLVKGLEYGLVNSRQNDSLLLFMTSDLVYGTENMGVVNPDQPVVWAVKSSETMIKVIRAILSVFIVAVSVASCAKQPSDDLGGRQQLAFEEWMKYYGDGAVKQSTGIYTKKLDSLPGNVIRHPQEGNWIRVNYTGRILNTGNIFVTRDSATAQLQGTFQYYTHYVPEYFQFKSDNGSVPSGMLYALGEMNAGDVVRAYIPYGLAYGTSGTSFGSGYEGQVASVPGSTPIIMDMELLEIVADPVIAENELVQDFAYNEWGKTIEDTVRANIYRRTLSLGKDTATVKADTTVSVYYVGRFMDGFVFDTNIEDTARKYNIYSSSNRYDSITVNTGGTDTTYVKGFYHAIVGMKFGETAQTVFTSAYGYGSTLQSPENETWINPYTPLMFTIMVIPPNGDGTAYHPYSIKGVKALTKDEDDVWITGYVVGAVDGASVETGAVYSDTVKVKTNILLSDIRTPDDASRVVAVELPEGTIRDKLNLVDNEAIYRKKIVVRGNIRQYLGQTGLVDVTQYVKK